MPPALPVVVYWLTLQVTTDQFVADTAQAPHVRVRDLALRVFKEHLYHTPLRLMGMDRNVRVPLGPADLDRIGRALAPVEPWGRYVQELELDGQHGGMTTLKMSQLRPTGRPPGCQVNVTVAPSARIGGGRSGIYIQVNDHYAIDNTEVDGGQRLMQYLADDFSASITRSNGIVDHVLSLARGG